MHPPKNKKGNLIKAFIDAILALEKNFESIVR